MSDKLPIAEIRSGGQTGVDQVGLRMGKAYGYPTGGWVPKGWRTDDGPAPWLADYGCHESHSPQYAPRTIANAREADLTIWFGDETSPGGRLTLRSAARYMINPSADNILLAIWALWDAIGRSITLNIAGNRLRTNPQASKTATRVLGDVLSAAPAAARQRRSAGVPGSATPPPAAVSALTTSPRVAASADLPPD